MIISRVRKLWSWSFRVVRSGRRRLSGVEDIGWDLKMGSYVVRVSRKKDAAVGRFRGLRSRVVFVQ